ncbi:MAG: hypothetical protein LBB27_03195 [Tannerellaceae bacterium]|jgi:uncharacterized protein YjdB|nr:hypothetical protein [Tannerellaceae bacterium]
MEAGMGLNVQARLRRSSSGAAAVGRLIVLALWGTMLCPGATFCGIGELEARTWYVKPKLYDAEDMNSPASSWQTAIRLWEALERAEAGDELLLQVGSYTATLPRPEGYYSYPIGKSLTIKGGYVGMQDDALSPSEKTILLPPAEHRVMVIAAGEVTLQNLTICNGNAAGEPDYLILGVNRYPATGKGGGLLVTGAASVTLIDVHFEDNRNLCADGAGGAIACLGGGGDAVPRIILKGRSVFARNVAATLGEQGRGGAIYAERLAEVNIFGSAYFSDNTAAAQGMGAGGAIYSCAQFTVKADTFVVERNYAAKAGAGYGGGLFFAAPQSALIQAKWASIEGNAATSSTNDEGYGGGIFLDGCVLRFQGGELRNNVASFSEATTKAAWGGACYLDNGASLDIDGGTVVSGNVATNGLGPAYGGAFYVNNHAILSLLDTWVTGNKVSKYAVSPPTSGSAVHRSSDSYFLTANATCIYNNEEPQMVFPDEVWTVNLPQLHPEVVYDKPWGAYAVKRGARFIFHPRTKRGFNLVALACTGRDPLSANANGIFDFVPTENVSLSFISPKVITIFDDKGRTSSAVSRRGIDIPLHTVVTPMEASIQTPTWAITPSNVATFIDGDAHASERTVRTEEFGATANVRAYIEEFPEVAVSYNITVAQKTVDSLSIRDSNGQTVALLNNATAFDVYATIFPANAPNPVLNWEISPPEAAEFTDVAVNTYRRISLLPGYTLPVKVIAKTTDGSNLAATFTIDSVHVPITSLQIVNSSGLTSSSIGYGDSPRLEVLITPSNATHKELRWSIVSMTPDCASFVLSNPSGTVRAVKADMAGVRFQVRVESTDGSKRYALHPIDVAEVSPRSVTLRNAAGASSIKMAYRQTITLYPRLSPEETTVRTVTWNIFPTGAAVFDDIYGTTPTLQDVPRHLKVLRPDVLVKVSVITANGHSDTFLIQTKPLPLDSIVVENPYGNRQTNTAKGSTIELQAILFPAESPDKGIAWDVRPENAARLTPSPNALTCGVEVLRSDVDIYVTAIATKETSNGVRGNHVIHIAPKPVVKVSLEDEGGGKSSVIPYNGSITLKASHAPEDADRAVYQWTVSPSGVLEFTDTNPINSVRTLKALKSGTQAIVTVSIGERESSYTVIVAERPNYASALTLHDANNTVVSEVLFGDSIELTASLFPTDALNNALEWEVMPVGYAVFTGGEGPTRTIKPTEPNATLIRVCVSTSNADYPDAPKLTAEYLISIGKTPLTGVSITNPNDASKTYHAGDIVSLVSSFTPEKGTNGALTWKVTPPEAAEVLGKDGDVIRSVKLLQANTRTGVSVHSKDGTNLSDTVYLTTESIDVENVSIICENENDDNAFNRNDIITLQAILNPSNATTQAVSWEISPEGAVAFLTPNDSAALKRQLQVKQSNVDVTVTVYADNRRRAASYTFHVRSTLVTALTLVAPPAPNIFHVGDKILLTADYLPTDATNPSLTWTISPEGAAEFLLPDEIDNQRERILHILRQEKLIKVSVFAGDGSNKTSFCSLTAETVPLEAFTLTDTNGRLESAIDVGATVCLVAGFLPSNATDTELDWQLSSEAAAFVSVTTETPGMKYVKALQPLSEVTVTATSKSRPILSCTYHLTINPYPITKISILNEQGQDSSYLNPNNTITLTADAFPIAGTLQAFDWHIFPIGAAEFVSNDQPTGKTQVIRALKANVTATVVAVAKDQAQRSAMHTLLIRPLTLQSFTLQDAEGNTSSTVDIYQNIPLEIVLTPSEAPLPTLQWTVDPVDAATLTEEVADDPLHRVLTPIRSDVTITVSVQPVDDLWPAATYSLAVRLIPITGLSLSAFNDISTIYMGETLALTAIITPSWATYQTLSWSISPENAASFSDPTSANSLTRTLTALQEWQKVDIVVTATDGTHAKAGFSFSILPPLSEVPVNETAPDVRYLAGGRLHLLRLAGVRCCLFDISGRVLDVFTPSTLDEEHFLSRPLPPGLYILSAPVPSRPQLFRLLVR